MKLLILLALIGSLGAIWSPVERGKIPVNNLTFLEIATTFNTTNYHLTMWLNRHLNQADRPRRSEEFAQLELVRRDGVFKYKINVCSNDWEDLQIESTTVPDVWRFSKTDTALTLAYRGGSSLVVALEFVFSSSENVNCMERFQKMVDFVLFPSLSSGAKKQPVVSYRVSEGKH